MIGIINDQDFWAFSSLSLGGFFALGHNLWLVAKNRRSKIRIEALTSDNFPESDSAVKPERIRDFRIAYGQRDVAPITDYRVEGDSLIADVESNNQNSFYVALELLPHPITLSAEKFAHYIADEDAAEKVAPFFIKNITVAPQRELYAKFAKVYCEHKSSLNDKTFNLRIGHKFEIVPQTVYSDLGSFKKLMVQVFFDNRPAADLRVSCGCANVNNGKYLIHQQTNKDGWATFEIPHSGQWFVRTHLILRHHDKDSFEWNSFWASLVFLIKK